MKYSVGDKVIVLYLPPQDQSYYGDKIGIECSIFRYEPEQNFPYSLYFKEPGVSGNNIMCAEEKELSTLPFQKLIQEVHV